jgi:hypothetical protein
MKLFSGLWVFTGFALPVASLIFGMWAQDVWEDRKHIVVMKSATLIFAGTGNGLCEGTKLKVAQPGTTLHVRRIRYWKNCATLDVALPDGGKGYLVLGVGEVSVSPSLP